MICRLPGDPLNVLAHDVLLTSSLYKKSWFVQVRDLLLMYGLPQPLVLLKNPPSKEAFKRQVKSKVCDYWEHKLRLEASLLPSLAFFNPNYYSLNFPHRIFSTAGQKTYEVAKARIQV